MQSAIPPVSAQAADEAIRRMLGDPNIFFGEHWRKHPYYAPNTASEFSGLYNVEQYLIDLAAVLPSPYHAVSVRDGNRVFSKHTTIPQLRDAIQEGGVSAIKTSRWWHQTLPDTWAWMRTLFGALCRYAAMIYMSPSRSEDVDLFLAGPSSGLGTHFDTTDVFTVQIFGERKWTVDENVHLQTILNLANDRNWYPAKEIEFQGQTREYILHPGDVLYVPAYGVHRVTGVSWSVSLSLGLRAFNEIDYIEHLLEAIRLNNYMNYPPVTSVSDLVEQGSVDAKLEFMQRIRTLLEQLEGIALTTLLKPMQLPPDLSGIELPTSQPDSEILGMFRSGFALHDEK